MPSSTPRPRHTSTHVTPSSRRPRPTQQRPQTPPLPPYELPILPLHPASQATLPTLLKPQSLRQLKTHLQHAEEKLTDSAGEVNERLTDARVRFERQKARKRGSEHLDENEGEGADDGGEEVGRLKELEEQVCSVTERLEVSMRKMVDAEVKVEGLVGVLGVFEREAEQAGAGSRSSRRRRRNGGGEDGEEEDDEDYVEREEGGDGEAPPTRKMDELLGESYAQWDGLSLTQRYSSNNAYIGFYRIIHEAKHPGDDIPPLPHASTWFSHLEDPTTAAPDRRTRHRRSPSAVDSDEIAIESERVSLKCPLTLLIFRDPVTSTKCPHSFEREAIEDMIAHSSTTVPAPQSAGAAGRSTRRVRSIKCPVCSVVLTLADLRPDPVLVRRVRRYEAALQREAEDEELSDGARRRRSGARKSGITLASDGVDGDSDSDEDEEDEMDVDSDDRPAPRSQQDHVRIKQEMSTAPEDDDDD